MTGHPTTARPDRTGALFWATVLATSLTFAIVVAAVLALGAAAGPQAAATAIPILGLALFLGLPAAVLLGMVGAALTLLPFMLLAERLTRRAIMTDRMAGVLCGSLAGLSFASAGWLLSLMPSSGPRAAIGLIFGFWPWLGAHDGHGEPGGVITLLTVAPILAGSVAGAVYIKLLREGLTTHAPSAI